jgi:hypothetical protein
MLCTAYGSTFRTTYQEGLGEKMKSEIAFEIVIQGQLSREWILDFGEVNLWYANRATHIRGTTIDQAALLGILQRFHGLGFTILSFVRLDKNNQTLNCDDLDS